MNPHPHQIEEIRLLEPLDGPTPPDYTTHPIPGTPFLLAAPDDYDADELADTIADLAQRLAPIAIRMRAAATNAEASK